MAHRVGIIGLGTVGARFVEQFDRHDAFDLVSGWDLDAATGAELADRVPIADDPDAVIAAADVVYIAVPPLAHRRYVERCAAADTAIFCEKPLGVDVAESRELVDLVEASGLPAGVNFVFSAAPAATGLLAAMPTLGDIVGTDIRLHFAEWPRAWHAKAQWLRLRDQGGWVREVLSHFVFLAQRAVGTLSIDTAHITFPDGADGELCETDGIARLAGASGPVNLLGTTGGAGPDIVEMTIRGTAGSIRLQDWYRLQRTDGDMWTDVAGGDRVVAGAEAYRAQLDALAALVDGAPSPIATFAEALAVQELVEALLTHR